ncbi:hypothetical protein Niako_3258 [Niastella koreensis GR20-10]|uniref:Uncharacterized protein n=1 Tax=Niastella koreensis (strain DSM 17620 / KACC 11465 / NBRC 106392 / GR20-10) TaxID=700598 RepID=G8TGY2_NIAKG|nr:hypothetical protein Niako_3258 [Niastella koreensis GR20-10]
MKILSLHGKNMRNRLDLHYTWNTGANLDNLLTLQRVKRDQ